MTETAMPILSDAALEDLPASVSRPGYDRSKITPGIVHIGLGNFHRAHQAWYLHRLMQQGKALDWGILGAGVRPYDAKMREKLLAQDCLTGLIELDPSGTSAEVTGAMIDYLPVEDGNGALIEAIARPEIRIVSLTVTEGGYYLDAETGGFDRNHADIIHDVANPETPRTAFGAIAAALAKRRQLGLGPIALQSCDNLQGNGSILRQTLVSLAGLIDLTLANWIEQTCTFPNSMVDCIVPATGATELALARTLGLADQAPVTHENFRQWVIEDTFCAGRPEWEAVGATFSGSVHAYEAMKIRMLNAGHQVLANAGELLSLETIDQCMTHPLIAGLFHKVEREEIAPYVEAVPEYTPDDYVTLIARRFANPAIRDTVRRVAFDGASRHPGFVVPILRDALTAGGSVRGLALVEALWARMCFGTREDGSQIEPNDPVWTDLQALAAQARTRPRAWIEEKRIYADLATKEAFADAFEAWLAQIWRDGTKATLMAYAKA